MATGKYNTPTGWKNIPLESVVTIHDRDRIPIKASERTPGQTPYCGANGIIDYVEGFTHEGEFVMLAEDGGFFGPGSRSSYVMNGKFWANNHVHVLCGKDGVLISSYLHYFLNNVDLKPYLTGATRPKLTQTAMKRIPILIPYFDEPERSLAEQKRIVARIEALLGEVREMRKLQEEITADVRQLMDAVRAEQFYRGANLPDGWAKLRIDSFAEVNPRRPQIVRDDEELTSFVPMAAVDEIRGDFAVVESRPFGEVKRGFTYFEENDVVFAKITPSMQNGKSSVAQNLIDGFGFGTTEFHVIRSIGSVIPDWIHQFVRQKHFLIEAMGHFRGAVGQQRVPPEFLASYKIPIPFPDDREKSLLTQTQIIEQMKSVQSEIWLMQSGEKEEDALLDNLEQAILEQAFRGEL